MMRDMVACEGGTRHKWRRVVAQEICKEAGEVM